MRFTRQDVLAIGFAACVTLWAVPELAHHQVPATVRPVPVTSRSGK